jgi:ParB-like nuclease domain
MEESTTPIMTKKYEIHSTAATFPMMTDEYLDELAADIKEHGLRDPIVLHEGKIIDGRNRLEGCHRAGVEPTFTEWAGSGSVISWIISVNLHRRHLTDQQRAMLSASVAQELAVEAKERSSRNLRNSGDPLEGLDPTPRAEGKSTERAAKLLNVSRDAAKKAVKVSKSGSKELVQAVTDGKVSLDAAALVSSLPKEEQSEIVAKGKVQEAAKQIRKEKAEVKEEPIPNKVLESTEVQPPNCNKEEPQPDSDEDKPQPTITPDKVDLADITEPSPKVVEEEVEETIASSVLTQEETQLLKESYTKLNKMVELAHYVGRTDNALKQLRSLVAHCDKIILQYSNKL